VFDPLLLDFANHPVSRSGQAHPFDGRLLISGLSTGRPFHGSSNASKVLQASDWAKEAFRLQASLL
jgi:hypothetical protein